METDENSPLLPAVSQKFKTKSKAALAVACGVVFSESFSMSFFLPFLYFMILDFEIVEQINVGFYTGILSSSFSIAQFMTGLYWGWASDRRGRRPILMMGLFINSVAIVIFGLSQKYYVAVFARLISGLFNGNLGISKSIIAEITEHSSRPFAFSLLGLFFMLGSISGPIVGGSFVDPAVNIPSWFGFEIFKRFKFLLPCLISSSVSLIVFIFTLVALPETSPNKVVYIDIEDLEQEVLQGSASEPIIEPTVGAQTNTYLAPSLLYQSSSHSPASSMNDLFQRITNRDNSSHAIWDAQSAGIDPIEEELSESEELISRISSVTIKTVTAYGLLTLQNVIFEEYFSIWAVAPPGHGLNLHSNYFGLVLGVIGILNIFFQLVLYPLLTQRYRLLDLYSISLMLFVPCWISLIFMPKLVAGMEQSLLLISMLLLTLAVRRLAVVTSFTSINVLISQSARPGELGFVNGLGQMIFSLMHAIGFCNFKLGPIISGLLWVFAESYAWPFPFDASLNFLLLTVATLITIVHSLFIRKNPQ